MPRGWEGDEKERCGGEACETCPLPPPTLCTPPAPSSLTGLGWREVSSGGAPFGARAGLLALVECRSAEIHSRATAHFFLAPNHQS